MRRSPSEPDATTELAQLSITAGNVMLRRVAESVRLTTNATSAFVVHRTAVASVGEVLASVGAGAPAEAETIEMPEAAPPQRIVLPLAIDGSPLGMIVVDGSTQQLTPQSQREIALLTGLGALALHNHVMVVEAERRALRHARQQYRLLTGTIYHLKNTLAVASEYIELLEVERDVTDMQREYVTRSRRSIGTALRLLSELHELGRTEAGELVPQPEPLNVVALIRDVVRDYRLSTGTTGIVFDLETPHVPLLRTDPDCVRQIFDTLLSNAVRYSPAEGHIVVRVSLRSGRRAGDPEQWIRIDVVDRGPGVIEHDAVFEEVQRVERKGLPGFRLAISRRIARLLGGDLTLDSEPGEGSTFSLWLPLHA